MTAWPGLELADHDTRSGITQTLASNLLDAQDHCQEQLYDSATQLPDAPHVHDGSDSPLLVMPDVPNLVTDSHPSTRGNASINMWRRTSVGVESSGLRFGSTGALATHALGDDGRVEQFAGCDIVIAFLARAREALTGLTFKFGITDGHTSTFETGAMASISETDLSVGGYRRYYTVIRNFDSTAMGTDVRVGFATAGTYAPVGTYMDVTAVFVKPCSVLGQWEPGYYTTRQHDLELIGVGDVPLWDDVMNFDRALYASPS